MKRIITTVSFLALGCAPESTSTPYTGYCGNNDGDAFCERTAPDSPFCVHSSSPCLEASSITDQHPNGCVAEAPAPECRQVCGVDEEDTCVDPTDPTLTTSTTDESSSTDTPTTGDTETGDESSSTTGPECSEDMPCMDAAAPFCVEGTCSTCEASVDPTPDEACAGLDEGFPLCVGTACVQCSAEDASACGGDTPLCDAEANSCVGCSFHEECQELDMPACNIATGACFDAANVTMVNGATDGALATAVANVADGAEHAIVLTGGGGNNAIVVDGGKTIAIISDGLTERNVQGSPGSPTLTVSGATSTAYLHRVSLTLNGDDVGVSVEASGTLYADSTRISQNSGGGITLAAGTTGFLRNSMVAGDGGNPGVPAVSASGATVEILYSTLGIDFNSGGPVLDCSGGSVSVRNSIIVSETSAAGSAVDCPGAALVNTPEETTLSPGDWFPSFASGDYSLSAAGGEEFEDVATWELGDPPFDFEGDDRPSRDGAADYAGADVP